MIRRIITIAGAVCLLAMPACDSGDGWRDQLFVDDLVEDELFGDPDVWSQHNHLVILDNDYHSHLAGRYHMHTEEEYTHPHTMEDLAVIRELRGQLP